jgi:Spy/CpxP family protein refolding chaperone
MSTSNRSQPSGTSRGAASATPLASRLHHGLVGLVAVAAATFALHASAQPSAASAPADGMRPPAGAPGMPPPPPHGEWHRGGPHGGPGGPGMMMDGRMIDRMLRSVDATDAQRTQVRAIVESARADLRSMAGQSRGEREQAMAIFTAPTIDANAAEALRQKSVAEHDQASKRMLTAMLDVANVLTPQQRAQLGARMKERGDHMRERLDARRGAPPAGAASGARP